MLELYIETLMCSMIHLLAINMTNLTTIYEFIYSIISLLALLAFSIGLPCYTMRNFEDLSDPIVM